MILFDSTHGIRFSDKYDMPYGSKNIVIKNNLIVDSGKEKLFQIRDWLGELIRKQRHLEN